MKHVNVNRRLHFVISLSRQWQHQEQTADLHGYSVASRLLLKLWKREGAFLLSKLMFLVLLVLSEENMGDDYQSMVERWILGRR